MKDIFETYGSAILAIFSISVVFGMAAYVFVNEGGGPLAGMLTRGLLYLG